LHEFARALGGAERPMAVGYVWIYHLGWRSVQYYYEIHMRGDVRLQGAVRPLPEVGPHV